MNGKPVPPGEYEWRTLQTQGLHSEYLISVGERYSRQSGGKI